jgi:hypothetical protein
METLLHERTTNQPRSVHSGRGGKSIAHDGWEAKSPMVSGLHHVPAILAHHAAPAVGSTPRQYGVVLRTAGYPPPVWRGTVSSAQHPCAALERLVHSRFVIPE